MSDVVVTYVGPQDHGRRMSLAEFDHAEVKEGYLYELGRGVVIVRDVPGKKHLAAVYTLRQLLAAYVLSHPGRIHTIAGSNECKLLVDGHQSERHPDLSIYKTEPPDTADIWATWVPEIVVEVVSPGSEHRDYLEKPDEYLAFGVHEYWIIDAAKQQLVLMRRTAGRWASTMLGPEDTLKTGLLPDFALELAPIFQAAR